VPIQGERGLLTGGGTRIYSGGLVAERCSHQIDFVNRIVGERPLEDKRENSYGY